MSKIKFNKNLKFLRELFLENQTALEAIDVLEKEADHLDFSPVKKTSSGDFPVPDNLKTEGYAVYSDGACRGNPGPGAWGMVAQNWKGEVLFFDSAVDEDTTNNRMELQGAIEGLSSLLEYFEKNGLPTDTETRLVSDSKYVLDGISKWVPGWKARGWKKADKKVPENVEQWKVLDELVNEFKNIDYEWVRGHQGHPQNEYCDQLANEALDNEGF
ncbi:MAG: ribonuclease HI [Bacteriovoracaceae bacterium]|nr:ribonuclease HI [Bacteriovoracaceae bacterium]